MDELFSSVGAVLLHLLAGFGGMFVGFIVMSIIIVGKRKKKQQEGEEDK